MSRPDVLTVPKFKISVRLGRGVLLVLAMALAVGLAVLVVRDQRAANRTESTAAATAAARKAVPALLSYKPDTVVSDLEAEKNLVTGTFAYDYRRLVNDVVGPAATKGKVTTKADVTGIGVDRLRKDSVTLLVFVNLTTTSAQATDPRLSGSRLKVTMKRVEADWRISGLDAV